MKLSTMATKGMTQTHSALYRKTGGKLGGRFRGSPTLLLTTTGRRSGKLRTTPLLYIDDGNRKVVGCRPRARSSPTKPTPPVGSCPPPPPARRGTTCSP